MTVQTMEELLLSSKLVSEETMRLIVKINGYNCFTMSEILYTIAGHTDFNHLRKMIAG